MIRAESNGADQSGGPDPAERPLIADPLLAYRARFPILERTNYLISNSLGAVPAAAAASLQAYYQTWATRGVRAWEDAWWTMVADLGDLVAPLIGAGPGEVVFQPNVTLAHAVILSAFDFTARANRIVTDAMHFPSILYLLEEKRREGAEVVVVPSHDGVTVDTGRVIEAIDDRTAIVCLSHVLFKSSYIHEIDSIIGQGPARGSDHRHRRLPGCRGDPRGCPGDRKRYLHRRVPEVAVRGAGRRIPVGASGHPPTPGAEVDRLDGPPGTVRIRARARASRRRLAASTWHSQHSGPLRGQTGPGGRARGRDCGDPGQVAPSDHSPAQPGRRGRFSLHDPRDPERRAGTVAIDVPNGYEVSRCLKSMEILCDYRPGAGIRLSPHFYTRDDELDSAIEAIREILASGRLAGPRRRPIDGDLSVDTRKAWTRMLCREDGAKTRERTRTR